MTIVSSDVNPGFAEALRARKDRLDLQLVERALEFSEAAHRGQKRLSGEDYVSHSIAVATILVNQQLDSTTVAAALLHDVVEDSDVRLEEIQEQFGEEVGGLVDGLTKISTLTFRSAAEEQSENYRKLLLSIARDARVIMVKLADRLHNMRTLEHLPEQKQRRISLETREIYAPLAHRFGMAGIKAELEDLAFKFLEPEDHRRIEALVNEKRGERRELISQLRKPLDSALKKAEITGYEITGRSKHLWSINRKMTQRGRTYEELYDLMAVRVLLDTVPDCYHVLGVIHHTWTPLQERFKDYIASPKSNAYQSLHTTIFGPGGNLYEIQIRTREMHRTAEYGIAAHWVYKEGNRRDELDDHFIWFRQLLELQQDAHTPEEFIEFLKIDLFQDEIFVFTPQGDVKRLPKDATPIDFAFAVHTEVGYRCQGAKVNRRIAPLHRTLKNGDTVEILTGSRARPSKDWLSHVRTARARQKIRQWIKQEESETSIALGKEIVARELRRRRLTAPGLNEVQAAADSLSQQSVDGLYNALGRGDVPIGQVLKALFPDRKDERLEPPKATIFGRVLDRFRTGRGVRVHGVDGLMVRYAQCCQPVPGDSVVGYVTKGHGISIHRSDCPNLLTMPDDPDRRVDIDWQSTEGEVFVVALGIRGEDRRGLYAEVMEQVSQTGTNIRSAELSSKDGAMSGSILVEVENHSHLAKVVRAVGRIKGIESVERHEPAPSSPSRQTF